MRVNIQGHLFDTEKATGHWEVLLHKLQINNEFGEERGTFSTIVDVYCSLEEIWYERGLAGWRLRTPSEILTDLGPSLTDEQRDEIAEYGGIEWE